MLYLTLLLSLVCAIGISSEAHSSAKIRILPPVEKLPVVQELPDPFLFANGTHVKTKADWARRRKEIKEQVQYYGFGFVPPAGGEVTADEESSTALTTIPGGATEKRYLLHTGPEGKVAVHLIVTVPAEANTANIHRRKHLPVIVVGDLCWGKVKPEIVAEVVKRSYLLAEFDRTEVAPDKAERAGGLYDIYPHKGDDDFGASAAWAWGFQRVVDYLLTRPDIDPKHIAVTGHSRGGKAVLLAGALDERIALTAPNDAGCMGTGCTRFLYTNNGTTKNETLALIVERFPFWFSPRLKTFIGHETQLPFDQHTMKALVAPRALLETQALEDYWANPQGAQVTYQAAKQVYDFLGAGDKIGAAYRPGGHDHLLPDWIALLDFADHQFYNKPLPQRFDALHYPDDAAHAFSWKAPGK